jgi:hypothetical protein
MAGNGRKVFASSKVNNHPERVEAYLRGERIHPVTMEVDLTQRCTRACPECPYSAPRRAGLTLQLPFLKRLFSVLCPHTPGLLLSGGEATSVAHFPETVALARTSGFREIAVITNGTRMHVPRVQEALLEHVTSVRVSLYDWQEGDSDSFLEILKRIEHLRNRVEREGSHLEIAAAMLTRTQMVPRLESVALQALRAGVHWLYFHPYCTDWEKERPRQADQTGVLQAIEALRASAPDASKIQTPYERYSSEPLFFSKLHGAHFLIQVGADGVNYAGPECKYREAYALLDLNEYLKDDFLWHPQRIGRLNAMNSDTYLPIGTKHRPPMFSHYIEQTIRQRAGGGGEKPPADTEGFLYPEII